MPHPYDMPFMMREKHFATGKVSIKKKTINRRGRSNIVYYIATIRGVWFCDDNKKWKFDTKDEALKVGKEWMKYFKKQKRR